MAELGRDEVISAQVILRPESGQRIDGLARITAETLRRYAPPPGAVGAAQEALRAMGFDTGPLVGVSFAISAPAHVFEGVLRKRLCRAEDGGVVLCDGARQLADADLPSELQDTVQTIAFPSPPDFGPREFMM